MCHDTILPPLLFIQCQRVGPLSTHCHRDKLQPSRRSEVRMDKSRWTSIHWKAISAIVSELWPMSSSKLLLDIQSASSLLYPLYMVDTQPELAEVSGALVHPCRILHWALYP